MLPEPDQLATSISRTTGLDFVVDAGVDSDGQHWYRFRPDQESKDHTFAIQMTIEWRRLCIVFEPGKFAGELMARMGNADENGRAAFRSVLAESREQGAQISLKIDDHRYEFDQDALWDEDWRRFDLSLNIGPLELGTDEGDPDAKIVSRWVSRFAAATVAILPLEQVSDGIEVDIAGYPEGAQITVKANRYERDRRNRAAAISIHGTSCFGCGLDMGKRYGQTAADYIEIHHVTPVAELGSDYVIDPKNDLIPLCPNCHAVVHRRNPPFSVDEIREFLRH